MPTVPHARDNDAPAPSAPVLLAALLCGALAGCAAGDANVREVPIALHNFAFAPATLEVAPGERVRFVLENESDRDHEFESDQARFEEVVVPPGRTRGITWTAPTRPGSYE